jgi:fluoroquinolone transport system permease protein
MNTIRLIRALGPLDARSILRDPLLRWMVILPLAFALALRGAIPALLAQAVERLPFALDIGPHYTPLMGLALLLIGPMLAGVVVGFLLLDLRDDGVLAALRVGPPRLRGYLLYRLALPTLVGLLLAPALFLVAGLPAGGPAGLAMAALGAAPVAALYALLLGAIAQNKVQGIALMKLSGLLFVMPALARYVPGLWQLPLALVPTYWPARLLWALQAGDHAAWLYLAGSLAYTPLVCALLLRAMERKG